MKTFGRFLCGAMLLLALSVGPAVAGQAAIANPVIVNGYTATGSIDAVIDGEVVTVPDDMANRHRQMIAAWEAQGNTIPPYVAPPPSTNPDDYPLKRYQFLALLDIAGIKPLVETAIANISDPVQRAVAQAKFDSTDIFNRTDPLLVQLAAAAGLTPEQVDAYWLQAKGL